jgi:thioredoxin reductase (NADPH)
MSHPAASTAVTVDVAIVGAGPVGLFTVFQCGMLGLSSCLIDTLETVGGQCAALYPEKPIYDIPAWPRITGGDLIARLEEQAAPFNPTFLLNQQVLGLAGQAGDWQLTTSTGASVQARAVIIAAGAGAFGPNRPPLEGLAAYEASGCVRYAVRRMEACAGKRVVIAGGGDSAVDWALNLAGVAASVAVVHRRPKFRAAPESLSRLNALAATGAVELVVPYQLAGLEGTGGQLTGVRVSTLDGEERLLPADLLLPFFGLAMELGPIAEWGLALDHNHIRVAPETMATSTRGIYAVGDIAQYPGKLKLILTGFSEAALAAHSARDLIHPDQPLHFEYSTTRGVPAAA